MAGGGPFTSATGLSGREVRPVGLSWGRAGVGGRLGMGG